jgi:molybdenum cofactor biosynthesis protein B
MSSPSTAEHRAEAERLPPVRVAVLTISDTRTEETDRSGALARERLVDSGHEVIEYRIVRDDPPAIRALVQAWADGGAVQAIVTNGGTGIAPRDGTFEAIHGLLDKELPGFGELFRMLSWHEVGAAAMLSRALGGLRGRCLIFCTPGSSNAVGLAMDKLIIPELAHLVWEVNRFSGP